MNINHVGQENLIPVKDVSLLSYANELVKKYMPEWDYEIPEINNPNVKFLLGISGGVDSAALAVVLLARHPELIGRMTLLFTDTGNEPDSCYSIIERLEEIFSVNVVTLKEKTLFGMIDDNGGFLPSAKSRYCTHALKILPWKNYLNKNMLVDGCTNIIAFSGLRWDERDRMGIYGIDNVDAYFPFVDQKIERSAVCSLASQLSLMNSAYLQGRSRSGCKVCFFMSKQELVSLKVWDPKSFTEGQSKEKVADHVLKRLSQDAIYNFKPYGFYTLYPLPKLVKSGKGSFTEKTLFGIERQDKEGTVHWDFREGATAKKAKAKPQGLNEWQTQLFEDEAQSEAESALVNSEISIIEEQEVTLYVGVENYKNSTMAMFSDDSAHGVWSQRLITFSSTLGGLSRALSGYHYHRQMSARGYFNDEDDYNSQSHITVMEIKFPAGVIPKITYGKDTYTWSNGRSYAEVAYIIRAIERVSELFSSKRLITQKRQHILTESAESVIRAWRLDGSPRLGQITGIGHYHPKPIEESVFDSYEEDAKTARCAICSI